MKHIAERVTCVVLASGTGERFGGKNKLFEKLPGGQTLLEQSMAVYQKVFETIHVVVRPENVKRLTLDDGVVYLTNERANLGLSQSIVQAVSQLPVDQGWLFGLGDMPYIAPSTVYAILEQASLTNIVQPEHKGRAGHPVYFGRSFLVSLLGLEGDIGARDVISRAKEGDLVRLSTSDPSIHWDIDRPPDIRNRD